MYIVSSKYIDALVVPPENAVLAVCCGHMRTATNA